MEDDKTTKRADDDATLFRHAGGIGPGEAPRSQARLDSRDLFGSRRTLAIRHGDEVYTLRITRADKLILTK